MNEEPVPDREKMEQFLLAASPPSDGPIVLTAIVADGGGIATASFSDASAAADWAIARNKQGANLYWTVNVVRGPMNKKPKKEDIEYARYACVDLDPSNPPSVEMSAGDLERWNDEERARIAERLERFEIIPTIVVDSGGGRQGLWRFDELLYIGGKSENWTKVEARSRHLGTLLGGDNTHNIDRIFRLPGGVNWPDAKKRAKGRKARLAVAVNLRTVTYPLERFEAADMGGKRVQTCSPPTVSLPTAIPPADLDALPTTVDLRIRMLIVQGEDPADPGRYRSKSEVVWAVACALVRAGCPDEMIASILLDPDLGISEHTLRQKHPVEYVARQIERARTEVELGEVASNGKRVLDPAAPFATAKRLHRELFPNTIHTNGDWLSYDRGAYSLAEDATMRRAVWEALDAAMVRKTKEDGVEYVPFKPSPGQVSGVLDALAAVAHQPAERMAPPVWLDGEGLPPDEIISCRNGLLHVPTGEMLPPTPRFFTRNVLNLDFDPSAPPPRAWMDFVGAVFPDAAAAELLQEWFGYFLLPDTTQEKMLLLVGPPRSGKGTIQKVLTKLVGLPNVCAPSIKSLGGTFGLQPMIGKQVAFLSDIRIGSGSDRLAITETLLRITGRDDVTADRKNKDAWTGRLAVRFFIATNEMPSLSDNSPALANRFVPLILERSFLGHEDQSLAERLVAELPGILNWSLTGLRRLRERGHFVLPDASNEAICEIMELGSPVAAFVRDMCVVEPGRCIEKDRLFAAWQQWCEANKLSHGRMEHFSRSLRAATSHRVDSARPTIDGQRTYVFEGIGLCERDDPY